MKGTDRALGGRNRTRKPVAKSWSGLCPAGAHGLDFAGQECDVCKHDLGGPCDQSWCRRCMAATRTAVKP